MQIYRKYYPEGVATPTDDPQPDWGVSVTTVGHNIHRPSCSYPDEQHPNQYLFDWDAGRVLDEYQLVYISSGHGLFEADGVAPTMVEAGTAFLLFPGVWHRYQPSRQTGWEEFWVGYKGPYAQYLMQQDCFSPASPFVHMGFHAELLQVFIRLIDTVRYEGVAFRPFASCLTIQLLALVYASALMASKNRTERDRILAAARYRIHEHFTETIDWEQLCRDLGVSYAWFRKAFKEGMGVAPGQYQLNLRLDRGRHLLKETSLSVGQIAYQLGFESEFYFSRFFKKKLGVAPGQFRKK